MTADVIEAGAPSRGARLYFPVFLVLIGAGLGSLWSLGQPWVTATTNAGFGDETTSVAGSSLYPLSLAGAWIALAAVVALVATTSSLRRAVGVVVVVAAAAILVGPVSFLLSSEVALVTESARISALSASRTSAWLLTAGCGLCVLFAGLAIVWYGPGWRSLSSRQSGTRQPKPSAWEALDRGEDPTA